MRVREWRFVEVIMMSEDVDCWYKSGARDGKRTSQCLLMTLSTG